MKLSDADFLIMTLYRFKVSKYFWHFYEWYKLFIFIYSFVYVYCAFLTSAKYVCAQWA